MRVGLFRRIGSFIIDALPVIATLSLCFSLFVGGLIKPDNYDEHMEAYKAKVAAFNAEALPYHNQLVAEEITQDEYNTIVGPIEESYEFDGEETSEQIQTYMTYIGRAVIYYLVGFNVVYFIYNAATKGNTFGRKFTKIELKGKVNFWTILLREIIWKTGYWGLTLGAGILVDMIMIGLTTKKLTFRDMVSQIRVTHAGVDYPF